MNMTTPAFDATALGYDNEFTYTQTGKYQRMQVWKHLLALEISSKKILEMNCGTGEDAMILAKKGAIVTATDISKEMLAVSTQKAIKAGINNINFTQWDLNEGFPFTLSEKFDIGFSNFGGWNCLSEKGIETLGEKLYKILAKDGQLCLVIMPSFCIWETCYFLLKGNLSSALRRRNKQGVFARLNENQTVLTYYYSPTTIKKYLSPYFSVEKIRPISFFIPPSYLDNFCKKIPFLLPSLFFLEKCVAWIPVLAYFSDHYLIVLRKKI